MTIHKRTLSVAQDHTNNNSSHVFRLHAAPNPAVSSDIPSSPPVKKRHRQHRALVLLTSLSLFVLLILLHSPTDPFEPSFRPHHHSRLLLRFDPLSLPPQSHLHGKYSGCLLLDGHLAPHNFSSAIFVDKDNEVLNGTGSQYIHRHRLPAYDYDEVKGLVVGFNNAFVYGAEPLVYDCHVKFRPGGANNLNVDGMGRALEEITLGVEDGLTLEERKAANDGNSSSMNMYGAGMGWQWPSNVPMPPYYRHRHGGASGEIEMIHETAVLIAQFWGERY